MSGIKHVATGFPNFTSNERNICNPTLGAWRDFEWKGLRNYTGLMRSAPPLFAIVHRYPRKSLIIRVCLDCHGRGRGFDTRNIFGTARMTGSEERVAASAAFATS